MPELAKCQADGCDKDESISSYRKSGWKITVRRPQLEGSIQLNIHLCRDHQSQVRIIQ